MQCKPKSSEGFIGLLAGFDSRVYQAPENFLARLRKPPLVVWWMLSASLRQMLRRAEFNGDVLLNRDRPFVQECGPVTPLANRVDCCRKHRGRAAQKLYILHLARCPDGGANLDGFRQCISIAGPGITGPDEGDKFPCLQASGAMSRRRSPLRRDEDRKFRSHGQRRGGGNWFLREVHPERFAAIGGRGDQDCGGC